MAHFYPNHCIFVLSHLTEILVAVMLIKKLPSHTYIKFQSRAKAATELLSELNDDVSGNYVEEVSIGL